MLANRDCTVTAKNLYIDEVHEINIKYNRTFHFPIKMKAIDFIS